MQHEFCSADDPSANDPSADDEPSVDRAGDELHRSLGSARSRLLDLLPPGIPMPAPGGWAASADLLLHLVDLIRQRRPSRIIELGSGTSTCWLAWALDAFDISGTVVSLEHLPAFRHRTLNHLRTCGVQRLAEVRLAPLTDVHVDGTTYRWYDPAGWGDLRDCDLLLVDGPPGHTAPMARYPAVPLLGPAMAPDAVVVLDDYKRPDEQRTVAGWLRLHPDWRLQVLEHKKGTAVLTTVTPISAHPT